MCSAWKTPRSSSRSSTKGEQVFSGSDGERHGFELVFGRSFRCQSVIGVVDDEIGPLTRGPGLVPGETKQRMLR